MEVQIVRDGHGNAVTFNGHICSNQCCFQKNFEEVSPIINPCETFLSSSWTSSHRMNYRCQSSSHPVASSHGNPIPQHSMEIHPLTFWRKTTQTEDSNLLQDQLSVSSSNLLPMYGDTLVLVLTKVFFTFSETK